MNREKETRPEKGKMSRLLKQFKNRTPQRPEIVKPGNATEPPALSFGQERLWLLHKLDPQSTAYNMPFPLRLKGNLHVPILETCLREIIARHQSLRTTFKVVNDQPVQIIAETQPFHLSYKDLSHLPPQDQEAKTQSLIDEDSALPFNLEEGPLYRASLLKLDESQFVLLQNMHHIISDGWSLSILFRELKTLMGACLRDPNTQLDKVLPKLTIQYPDFGEWQRKRLTGNFLKNQLSWWTTHLEGEPPVLDLPTDWQRPPKPIHGGALLKQNLPLNLTKDLNQLARDHGVSLFMTLIAAFKVLLLRLTGQNDIVAGVPVAGRLRVELEQLIGFFLNTLPLRTQIREDMSFKELLGEVRGNVLGAFAHQEIPFEKLLSEIQPGRQISRSPLFQFLFNVTNMPVEETNLPGLTMEPMEVQDLESKVDFTLYISEGQGQIEFNLLYDTSLFSKPRMEELLAQYQRLLTQVVKQPDKAVSHYSLYSQSSRLPDPTRCLAPHFEKALHQQVAAIAAEGPTRIALVDPYETWTYEELDCRANQLAHHLLSHGVRPKDVVNIYAHRSASLVWALLGVLKTGASYVMLDSIYPTSRLKAIIKASQPTGWIEIEPPAQNLEIDPDLSQHVDSQVRCRVTLPPRSKAQAQGFLARRPAVDPAIPIDPHQTSYLAFTSGTTGVPKGILGRHGSMTHFLPIMSKRFGMDGSDRYCLLSALSHDPLHRDVFLPLWNGGRLYIPESEKLMTPGYLMNWIHENAITVANMAPVMLRILCMEPPHKMKPGALNSLRHAFMVGDVLTRDNVMALYLRAPNVRAVNYYGSTETQHSLAYYLVPRPEEASPSNGRLEKKGLPLGASMGDIQHLLLNQANEMAGVGEIAEIYVRSRYLASGYLNNPELTAKQFIQNPYSADPHDRLYRTGDLGRYLPSGEITFLGRADLQVQIRGFRIELTEIEAALASHEAISEAVVKRYGEDTENARLAAYMVVETTEPQVADLRKFLTGKLPEYMIPSAFLFIPALPLTKTGKVDRKALPDPDPLKQDPEDHYAAPRRGEEDILATIWCDVLGLERVGIHDNFFELGGHSLMGTRVLARVRSVFEVELSLRELFDHPTIAGLAQGVIEARRGIFGSSRPPLKTFDRVGRPPLSFAQKRMWFLDQLDPGSPAYLISGALRFHGDLDIDALRKAFNVMAQRHESLRTRFLTLDGEAVVQIDDHLDLSVQVLDLESVPEQERWQQALTLAAEESRVPFNLSIGPLVRVRLLRLSARDHVLLLTIHHIISDGWSQGVFFTELSILYEAFLAGIPTARALCRLNPLPIQYMDYAHWEHSWLQGEVLEKAFSYWKSQLEGAPPVLELATDHPRPHVQTYNGNRVRLTLPEELSKSIRAYSRKESVSFFMILLAAYKVLLCSHARQSDIVIGAPVAHRNHQELESLIGFFVNTLVMRTDLTDEPTFKELCHRIRATALGAYAHQFMPFEILVDRLSPERDLTHTPLFQAMFILQNPPAGTMSFGDLTLETVDIAFKRAQYDITLTLVDMDGGFFGWLEYNTDLFEQATIEAMAKRYETFLTRALDKPEIPVFRLSMFPEAEQKKVARSWNLQGTPYSSDVCFHELLEAQVLKTPDARALSCGSESLTYRELNEWANRIAHYLRSLGAGPEVMVGLLMERSAGMVASLLAILKSGAAYLPLDPDYPTARLDHMMEDSGATLLLTRDDLDKDLNGANSGRWRRIDLHAEAASITTCSPENPEVPSVSTNLAYVIYTSGSTGKPKGVQITHQTLNNFLQSMAILPGLTERDILLAVTPVSFDISGLELLLPLMKGAQLVVATRETSTDGLALADLLTSSGTTVMQATPSTWRMMLAGGWTGSQNLKILCGGEAMPEDLARTLLHCSASLWNMYGPTETTIWSMVDHIKDRPSNQVTIGTPIANTGIYLLSKRLEPSPPGVPGELWIGGEGLSRGYLHQPGLTAERFIPNPFSNQAGARMYRTGDLANLLRDGRFSFLGRIDHQVKLRGFRIELGEIETVLNAHSGVAQGVAGICGGGNEPKRLVAWVIPNGDMPQREDLTVHLQKSLPEYMTPTVFIPMDRLPLTPNGKIHRAALPKPGQEQLVSEHYQAPSSAVETSLAGVWSEILKVERIGVNDNFFDLGGDSILVIKAVSLGRKSGLRFQPKMMFQHQTLGELARVVTTVELSDETEPAQNPASHEAEPILHPDADLSQKDFENLLEDLGDL